MCYARGGKGDYLFENYLADWLRYVGMSVSISYPIDHPDSQASLRLAFLMTAIGSSLLRAQDCAT